MAASIKNLSVIDGLRWWAQRPLDPAPLEPHGIGLADDDVVGSGILRQVVHARRGVGKDPGGGAGEVPQAA